jgi:F0F1-type ATP synthase delta subunit
MMNTLNSNFQKKIEEVEKSQATQVLKAEKTKHEGTEVAELLLRVNANVQRLEILNKNNTETLTELDEFRDQVRSHIVTAHNLLCADVEEMDFLLEKIHRNRYNNTRSIRGKRKIIFKGRQT